VRTYRRRPAPRPLRETLVDKAIAVAIAVPTAVVLWLLTMWWLLGR
jgi:hypothetical protein